MIRSMRRTTSTLLTLAATVMLLAGCGSSSHASSVGAPVGADKPIPSPQAVTYADAVNLRAADVPGLQAARHEPKRETAAGPYRGRINRCDDAAALPGDVMGIHSPRFVHIGSLPLESVSSGVYYFKSEALARRYLAAPDGARFAACLETVASHEPKTVTCEGSKVAEPISSDPRLSTLPASLPGALTYGLRLAAHSACGAPGRSENYEDFLSFVRGDAVITLSTFGEPHPFPAAGERRLLSVLYRRAVAHKL
jgi:hypothetical protein